MNSEKLTDELTGWIKNFVKNAAAEGLVVGLSGGIDSAVVAALCKKAFPGNCLGVIMPCYSQQVDLEYAKKLAEKINLPVQTVQLDEVFDAFLKAVDKSHSGMARANVKPRLRMTALYFLAAEHNYLVAGTGNRSELEIGYFTKYGDGGVDFEPIGGLLKTEVRQLAAYLGIPVEIINREPTAGLWENQTDEEEMGITYQELDNYLMTGAGSKELAEKVQELQRRSNHKRQMPPSPSFF